MSVLFAAASSQRGTITTYSPTTGDVSVESWYYPTSNTATSGGLFSFGTLTDFTMFFLPFWDSGSGTKQFVQGRVGGGAPSLEIGTLLSLNAWHYFRVKWDTAGTLYYDAWDTALANEISTSGSVTAGARDAGDRLEIGRKIQTASSAYANGRLRNLTILNSLATDAQSLSRALQSNPLHTGPGTIDLLCPLVDANDTRELKANLAITYSGSPTTADDPQNLPNQY